MLENRTQVGIGGIKGERDRNIRARMDQLRNGREKSLGSGEGRVQHRRPGKGARNQAAPWRNFLWKLSIPKNLWRAGLSGGGGKAGDGGKVFVQRRTTVGREEMSKKFNLRN